VRDVETGDGLVQQQPAGLSIHDRSPDLTEDPGKLRALLLAAGELLIKPMGEAANPNYS
jgi:hypothetical protein